MTNLEAMQDARLREMIHDVDLLEKLLENLITDYDEVHPIIQERTELKNQITERWRELLKG